MRLYEMDRKKNMLPGAGCRCTYRAINRQSSYRVQMYEPIPMKRIVEEKQEVKEEKISRRRKEKKDGGIEGAHSGAEQPRIST